MLDVVKLTEKMVAFETESQKSNLPLANFLKELLVPMGFKVIFQEREEGNGVTKANLIARIGPPNVETLMLSGHMDVMPIGEPAKWTTEPFKLTEADGKQYGRGSVDMKGPMAAMICAVEQLLPQIDRLKRELMFGLTYDEEVGLKGAKRMVDAKIVRPKFILIAEPTELIPVRAHKGHLGLTAFCWGEGGHSSVPSKGRNAILLAAKVISELEEFGEELKGVKESSIDPPYATINVAEVRGAFKLNEIPDCCEVDFAIRPIPGQTTQRIRQYITDRLVERTRYDKDGLPLVTVDLYMQEVDRNKDEKAMKEAIENDRKLAKEEVKMGKKNRKPLTKRKWVMGGRKGTKKTPTEPMSTSADSELVRVAETVTGISARGECYSTDASELQRIGAECLILGPGSISVAHKPNEYIETRQLVKGVEKFREIISRMCFGGGI